MNSPRAAPQLAIFFFFFAATIFAASVQPLLADPNSHVTDGFFTSASEWTGPTVTQLFFPVSGQAGGAYLYVEQGFKPPPAATSPNAAVQPQDTLFLMYDWVNSPSVFPPGDPSVYSDVYFQVNSQTNPNDYLVRIFQNSTNSFQAFERTHGSTPPLNPDGSFDISSGSGWTSLTSTDLSLANFHTAIGLGTSPNSSTNHIMAEFQLSINNSGDPQNPTGLYDPSPAFWSASGDGNSPTSTNAKGDPPISSGIFTLNANGTTSVNPQFDSTGAPAKIPSQAVPEPVSLLLLGMGALMLLGRRVHHLR